MVHTLVGQVDVRELYAICIYFQFLDFQIFSCFFLSKLILREKHTSVFVFISILSFSFIDNIVDVEGIIERIYALYFYM